MVSGEESEGHALAAFDGDEVISFIFDEIHALDFFTVCFALQADLDRLRVKEVVSHCPDAAKLWACVEHQPTDAKSIWLEVLSSL